MTNSLSTVSNIVTANQSPTKTTGQSSQKKAGNSSSEGFHTNLTGSPQSTSASTSKNKQIQALKEKIQQLKLSNLPNKEEKIQQLRLQILQLQASNGTSLKGSKVNTTI